MTGDLCDFFHVEFLCQEQDGLPLLGYGWVDDTGPYIRRVVEEPQKVLEILAVHVAEDDRIVDVKSF